MKFTYESTLLALKDFHDLTFRLGTFTFGEKLYFHFVSIHGMPGITFSDKYRRTSVFRDERILSIAAACESSYGHGSQSVETVTATVDLGDDILGGQVIQDVYHLQFLHLVLDSDDLADLFIVERFLGRGLENGNDSLDHRFFFHTFTRSFVLFAFFLFVIFFCRFILCHSV